MAPWLSSGHIENAMLALVRISCMAMPTSHGNPPPPYSGGNGHAVPAGVDVGLVGRREALGRGDGAVVVADAALLVADAVQRRDEVLHEPGVLLEDAVDAVGVDVLEAGELGDRLARSTRCSRTKRMSRSGAVYSAIAPA